jgi:steroid delta-isomerase-like uncharacterized protein
MTPDQTTVPSSKGSSGMTRDEIVAFIDHRQECFDDFDAAGLAADYADDAVIESPMSGRHTGPAAAERAWRAVFEAFLDIKWTTDAVLIDGDRVAHFATCEGTHMSDFMGVPATHKSFHLPVAFLYELKDRKIVRERRIYDFTGMLVQIGLLKAKPV